MLPRKDVYGTVTEVEEYRGTYMFSYLSRRTKKKSVAVVFPDLPNLPQPLTLPDGSKPFSHLYITTAWLYWKDHIWPMPVGLNGVLKQQVTIDMRQYTRDKVDHVLDLARPMTQQIELNPGDDREYGFWKKWMR